MIETLAKGAGLCYISFWERECPFGGRFWNGNARSAAVFIWGEFLQPKHVAFFGNPGLRINTDKKPPILQD